MFIDSQNLDGIEATIMIRASPADSDIQIITITSFARSRDKEKIM